MLKIPNVTNIKKKVIHNSGVVLLKKSNHFLLTLKPINLVSYLLVV